MESDHIADKKEYEHGKEHDKEHDSEDGKKEQEDGKDNNEQYVNENNEQYGNDNNEHGHVNNEQYVNDNNEHGHVNNEQHANESNELEHSNESNQQDEIPYLEDSTHPVHTEETITTTSTKSTEKINLTPIPQVLPSEVTTLKIFIGSISPNTTDNTYFKFFGKYGEMSDWVLMKRPDGKNKGFGFVTYKSKEVVAKVLSERLIIDGKEVQAYQAIPKETMAKDVKEESTSRDTKHNGSEKDKKPAKTNRLFIGSLTPAVVDNDIKNYFGKYGKLEDYFVMLEKVTNRPRGFGFAVFEHAGDAEKVLADGSKHNLLIGSTGNTIRVNVEKASILNNEKLADTKSRKANASSRSSDRRDNEDKYRRRSPSPYDRDIGYDRRDDRYSRHSPPRRYEDERRGYRRSRSPDRRFDDRYYRGDLRDDYRGAPAPYYAPDLSAQYDQSRPLPPVSGVAPYYEPRPAYDPYTPDINVPSNRAPAVVPSYPQQAPVNPSSYYRSNAPTSSVPPQTSAPYDNRRPYDANPASQPYYSSQTVSSTNKPPAAVNPYNTANLASLLQATAKAPETSSYVQPTSNAAADYYRTANPTAYPTQPTAGYNPYSNATAAYGNPSYGAVPTQVAQGQYAYQANYPQQNVPAASTNKNQQQQQGGQQFNRPY